jgi:hypothetical protein
MEPPSRLASADVLMCVPVEWQRDTSRIPGSVIRACASCDWPILVAPTGVTLLAERPSLIALCLPCAELWAPDAVPAPLTAAQRAELRAARAARTPPAD